MILLSSSLIAILISECLIKAGSQCFPIDGRVTIPGSSLLSTITPILHHDRGRSPTILVDGDMLTSHNSIRRSQVSKKHDSTSQSTRPNSSFHGQSPPVGRASESWRDLLWPGNVIPFKYHESIDDFKRSLIVKAMDHFETNTCIKFREREARDEYWVVFRSDSSGCFAFLGRDDSCRGQGQPVSLSRGCDTVLIAAHEIAHVVGLKHQHNRPDRDENIHINWSNIARINQRYFRKDDRAETFGLPYDLTSLMQYNMWHFSSDVYNRSSMVTLNPIDQRLLGKSSGLSFLDRKQVNFMYSCNGSCENLNEVVCLNDGYLYPIGGESENCECQCPPHFTGKWCEIRLSRSYYEAINPFVCGGIVNGSDSSSKRGATVIETSGYPNPREPKISCTWIVEVPHDVTAVLTFESFNLTSRSKEVDKPWSGKCMNESLEIRLDQGFEGKFYCGSDLRAGQTMIFAKIRQIILMIQSFDDLSGGSFRALLKFISVEDSTPHKTETWTTSKPTSPTTEGHMDESQSGTNKDVLGFPVDRLIALPFQLIASIIKTFSETLERG